jgi:hypothetical protein
MADQESRGGDGDPDPDEEDSIMGVNLAEGYGTVNREARRVKRATYETSATWTDGSFRVSPVPQVSPVSRG